MLSGFEPSSSARYASAADVLLVGVCGSLVRRRGRQERRSVKEPASCMRLGRFLPALKVIVPGIRRRSPVCSAVSEYYGIEPGSAIH